MKVFALRLQANEDLKQHLTKFVNTNHLKSGFILTAVGSFQQVTLRFAGHPYGQAFKSQFQLISLVGTLSVNGLDIHLAVADASGKIIGGHLMNGSIIYKKAEIIIGSADEVNSFNTLNEKVGANELEVFKHNHN